MNLANFDKKQNSSKVNFSAVMEVEARIFTTPDGKNDYSTTARVTTKTSSASSATKNTNK